MRFFFLYNRKRALAIKLCSLFLLNGIGLIKAQLKLTTQNCFINVKAGTGIGVNGEIILESNAQIDNSGTIDLKENWTNNSSTPVFIYGNTGYVRFSGGNQLIGGSASTSFSNITLTGTGIKTISNTSQLSINGSLNVGETGISAVTLLNQKNDFIVVKGDLIVNTGSTFQNNGTGFDVQANTNILGYFTGNKNLLFSGNNSQTISGIALSEVGSIKINKASGNVVLATPVLVDNLLTLTSGLIETDNTNILTINSNATVVGGSDNSYVSGPVKKIGNSAFTFPIGDKGLTSGAYHPLSITAPASSSDVFSAQYFAKNVSIDHPTYSVIEPDTLESISDCEYWSLNHIAGSSSVTPEIGWNTNSCNVSQAENLALSYWDGTSWKAMGLLPATVTGSTGTLGSSRPGPAALGELPLAIGHMKNFTVSAGPDRAVCQKGSVLLAGSVSGLHGSLVYSWAPSAGLSSSTVLQPTASPGVTTTYTLTVTETTLLHRVRTDNVLVTVNANPSVALTPIPASFCAGGSIPLNASGAVTYAWSPTTGLNAVTGSSVIANPSANTVYTVLGTGENGCVSSASLLVKVNPLPVVTVTPASSVVCSGASVSLTAGGASSYAWTPSSGLSSTTGASVVATPLSNTSYTVVAADVNGCSSSAVAVITVNSGLTVAVTGGSSVCEGNSLALTATGATTYSWSPSAGLNLTTGSSVSASPSSTTTYTVIGTDVNGCSGSANAIVTVNPLPTVSITPPFAGTLAGESTLLTASGASTYTWTPFSLGTGTSVTVSPIVSTTYTVTGLSVSGCSSTATATVFVKQCNLDIQPGLLIPVCNGESVVVTAASSYENSTYSWQNTASGGSAIVGNTITVDANSIGQWVVSLYLNNNGLACGTQILNVVLREDCDEEINGCSFNNYGASVKVQPGTHLNVYCNLLNELGMSSAFTLAKGEFENQGDINVKLDWIHNAQNNLFVSNSGVSSMFGYDQKMRGNSITHFSKLHLDGNGVKRIEINEYCDDKLDLKSNELFLGNFDFFLTNVTPGVQTIDRSNGFASTNGTGYLSQEMLAGVDYLFPMGSNVTPPFRYRPLEISNTSNDNVSVNFKNEAYSSFLKAPSVVNVNNLFYHNIKHTNASALNKKIKSFFAPSEGAFQSIAHWEENGASTPVYWWGKTLSPAASNVANLEGLVYALTNDVQNFNGEPFALAESGFYIGTTGFGTSSTGGSGPGSGSIGDSNNDGVISSGEIGGDINNNGVIDNGEIAGDCNGDGVIGSTEVAGDINCDGSTTGTELTGDTNGDGSIDGSETSGDNNGDGVIDGGETSGQTNTTTSLADINGDGVIGPGETAGDSNGNGVIDPGEISGDLNGDGVIDNGEVAGDTNGNGTIDAGETAGDSNGDGTIGAGECNSTLPFTTTVALAGDVNNNNVIDGAEIAGDINNNGTIDPCETAGDLNGDGVIGTNESMGDTNGDGSIDSGEVAGDANGNGQINPGESSGEPSGGSGVVITITSGGSSTGPDLGNPYGTGGTTTLTPSPPVGPFTMTIIPNDCGIPGKIDFTINPDGTIDPSTVVYSSLGTTAGSGELSPEVYSIDNINSGLNIISAPSSILTQCVNTIKVSMGAVQKDFILLKAPPASETIEVFIPNITTGLSVGNFKIYNDSNILIYTSPSVMINGNNSIVWGAAETEGVYNFGLDVTYSSGGTSTTETIKGQFILK